MVGKTETFLVGFFVYGVQKALRLAAANHLHQNGYWLLYGVFALMFKKGNNLCTRHIVHTRTLTTRPEFCSHQGTSGLVNNNNNNNKGHRLSQEYEYKYPA